MVAGLLVQLPQPQLGEGTRLSAEQLGIENGLACQISSPGVKSWRAAMRRQTARSTLSAPAFTTS